MTLLRAFFFSGRFRVIVKIFSETSILVAKKFKPFKKAHEDDLKDRKIVKL